MRQRRPGRRRARRQGHQQGLGRLPHRPAALADRDRGRPGRLRGAAHAAAVQRLHAERAGAGAGDRRDERLRLLGRPGRIGMVDARDVGAVAAEIAASPAPHAGKTYWLTGPELISNDDVAAVLSRLLGRTITYRPLSFDEDRDAMVRAGVPEPIAEMNAQAVTPERRRRRRLDHRRCSVAPRPPGALLPSSSPPTTPPPSPRSTNRLTTTSLDQRGRAHDSSDSSPMSSLSCPASSARRAAGGSPMMLSASAAASRPAGSG